MIAQKSVCTSLGCFRLLQKSLAPDSRFRVPPTPWGRASPRPGFCQIGDSLYRQCLANKEACTFKEGTVSLAHFLHEVQGRNDIRTELPVRIAHHRFWLRSESLICCRCLVAQSCPTLCNPTDSSPPGSSVHGISQARILEWVAMPFSRGSSWPRNRTRVSWIAGRFFNSWATREALFKVYYSSKFRFNRPGKDPENCVFHQHFRWFL